MSLNQLPDELIAHIGTFLKFKDNRQFAQSQKRIQRTLKRYGLDKPECYSLFLDFPSKLKWVKFDEDNREYPLVEDIRKTQDETINSYVKNTINQYRCINELELYECRSLNDDIFDVLLSTKTKTDLLILSGGEVISSDLSTLIAVCKKFNTKIDFLEGLPATFYSDDVFLQILPTTILNPYEFHLKDGSRLTNRTLLALTSFPTLPTFWEIDYVYNSFTVMGIKHMVQIIVNSPAAIFRYDLGILKSKEEFDADLWCFEVSNLAECPYIIIRMDAPDPHDYLVYYTIQFNEGTAHFKSSIRFGINRSYL